MNHKLKIEDLLKGVQKNVGLASYTTFKIGGPAKYFFEAKTKEDLIKAIKAAKKINLPFSILGGGSNLLVSDNGFAGLIIRLKIENCKLQNSKIVAGAGKELEGLVTASARAGLTGLEWAAGIPGTIGGAIRGNAAALESSMSDLIGQVEVFDCESLQVKRLESMECQFDYKDSVFKQKSNLVILSAELQLEKGKKKEIEKKIKEYLEYREENHPLEFPSAGCIFQNQKSKIKNQKLLEEFPKLIQFNKQEEIPAGYLIEKCGLKGKRIGGAQISEKHANFIVNLGNAKAIDVKKLIELIKEKVQEKFGIELKEEIEYLGF